MIYNMVSDFLILANTIKCMLQGTMTIIEHFKCMLNSFG